MKQIKQYIIKEEIGRGGMSMVYRASVRNTNKAVALKVMRENLVGNEQAHTRFVQEVQTVIALAHPAITPILEYGLENDRLYIVMDYMAGGSVRQLLEDGPLPLERCIAILQQVALALDAAHEQSIIHRDVKPHNILLDEAGQAYLSDFGIARSMDGEGPGKTITLIGTPEYVAPEQVVEGELSTKTDIYQLGVSLFQMLTGELPFSGSSYQIMSQHLNEPLPSAEVLNLALPVGCDAVLRRATAKNPADRYPSAGALAEALATVTERMTATNLLALPLASPVIQPLVAGPDVPDHKETSEAALHAVVAKRPSMMRRALTLTTGGALAGSLLLFSMGFFPALFGPPPPPPVPETGQATQLIPASDDLDPGQTAPAAEPVPGRQLATVPDDDQANSTISNDTPLPQARPGIDAQRVTRNNGLAPTVSNPPARPLANTTTAVNDSVANETLERVTLDLNRPPQSSENTAESVEQGGGSETTLFENNLLQPQNRVAEEPAATVAEDTPMVEDNQADSAESNDSRPAADPIPENNDDGQGPAENRPNDGDQNAGNDQANDNNDGGGNNNGGQGNGGGDRGNNNGNGNDGRQNRRG